MEQLLTKPLQGVHMQGSSLTPSEPSSLKTGGWKKSPKKKKKFVKSYLLHESWWKQNCGKAKPHVEAVTTCNITVTTCKVSVTTCYRSVAGVVVMFIHALAHKVTQTGYHLWSIIQWCNGVCVWFACVWGMKKVRRVGNKGNCSSEALTVRENRIKIINSLLLLWKIGPFFFFANTGFIPFAGYES